MSTLYLTEEYTSSYHERHNNSDNDINEMAHHKFTTVIFYVIGTIGIPSNILTMCILLSTVKLRNKPMNLILAHQACIDMLVCMLTAIEEITNERLEKSYLIICHLVTTRYLSTVCLFMSTYNVAVLSLEQHAAIVDPFGYQQDQVRKRLPYIFCCLWIFFASAFMVVPTTTEVKDSTCYVVYNIGKFWDIYPGYEFTLAIAIPTTLTIIVYSRMFYYLRLSSRTNLTAGQVTSSTDKQSQNLKKLRLAQMTIFKTCVLLVAVYLICWTTVESAIMLYSLHIYEDLNGLHYTIGNILVVGSSGINPFIYMTSHEDFKKQFRKMFC